MEDMKSKNKKPFTPFTLFTLTTSLTPFTLSNSGWVNEGKRTPFTGFSYQPCGCERKVNEVTALIKKCIFKLDLGKRPEITPFTGRSHLGAPGLLLRESLILGTIS
jgi:hypothetical protein